MSDDVTLDVQPTALFDADCPLPLRREALKTFVNAEGRKARDVIDKLLERAAAARDAARCAEKLRELEEALELLQSGPLRAAVYMGRGAPGFGERRAHVLFNDNTEAQVFVPDEALVEELRRGDTVWVEAQGRALLGRVPGGNEVGEIVRVEKRVDAQRVSVSLDETGRAVWRLSAALSEALDRGEVAEGSEVIGCPVRKLAFSAVKSEQGPRDYQFLERRAPPAIDLERDLGAPHAFIADLAEHVETEMIQPELARSFGLGRSRALLLTGAPGTGKTFSIQALWRRIYEVLSRLTGVPIDALPPRVLRMRPARVLSMWLGQSDKNIDRLFDEARMLADETFVGPDGREHRLPVVLIGEEIESLTRKRGHDAVHDRIQTTLLERFETSAEEWRDRLVIFVFTTNLPQLVDSAMFRRAGGEHVRLRGLERRSFSAVLDKHLRKRRLRARLGADGELARARLVAELAAWLFAPGADDPGQVEIHLLGQPAPLVKHRRDFLTAALVQRAVERASQAACRAGRGGDPDAGLDRVALARALHDQVRAIVEHLDPSNVATYIELARDVQVRAVSPVRQPTLLSAELELPATT